MPDSVTAERWAAVAGALLTRATDLDAAAAALRDYLLTADTGGLPDPRSAERLRSLLPRTEREVVLAVELGVAWARGRLSTGLLSGIWSPVVSGPDLDPRAFPRLTGETLIGLIGRAASRILMATAYLDGAGVRALLPSLSAAARRGVPIEFAAVERLARDGALDVLERALAGHELTLHRLRSGDRFPHCKVLVVDGRIAYIGSANFTLAGMSSNYELGAIVEGEAVESIQHLVSLLLDRAGAEAA